MTRTLQRALAGCAMLLPLHAHAEVSANLGWSSDYYYRGVFQSASSPFGGADWSGGGFYGGAWAADVDDGLEIDGYFGYAQEFRGVTLSAGFTGYYYTQDFDDTYQEVNLGAAIDFATIDLAFGEYHNFGGPAQDYSWYALTLRQNGFHARVAGFSRDFHGNYLEVGYSLTAAELELGLTLILADDDLAGESTESLVFTVARTFEIG